MYIFEKNIDKIYIDNILMLNNKPMLKDVNKNQHSNFLIILIIIICI